MATISTNNVWLLNPKVLMINYFLVTKKKKKNRIVVKKFKNQKSKETKTECLYITSSSVKGWASQPCWSRPS
ncbi:hypothetical protein Hanom_Chr16g01497861 [Helianthus anomalus]